MDKLVLMTNNLNKQYAGAFGLEVPHLEFMAGQIYAVIGPNGAGKSTLLNLLSLLDAPSAGEIFFKGQAVTPSHALDIRRQMSMVMEDPLLFHTSVYKNIISGLKCRLTTDPTKWPEMAAEVLEMVGLSGFEKRQAHTLSRGETQRVAIARALVLQPEILFLDEPFTNIDKKNVALLEKLIQTINHKYRSTIIFTTHDLWQAYRLADNVISIVAGKLINGSLENLFAGVVEEVNGLQFVRLSADVLISVVTKERGSVHVCIPPQDIILSHEHIESSARNSFKGIVKKIQMEAQVVKLVINVA